MLNVTWERKDLSFNSQGFLSNPSMVIIALDRERTWDKVTTPILWFNLAKEQKRLPLKASLTLIFKALFAKSFPLKDAIHSTSAPGPGHIGFMRFCLETRVG